MQIGKYSLIINLIFFLPFYTNAQLDKVKVHDSSWKQINFKDHKIFLKNSVTNLEYWLEILREDTVLISYFKNETNQHILSISSIENKYGSPLTYIFKIHYSLKLKGETLKDYFLGNGPVFYQVKLSLPSKKNQVIQEIVKVSDIQL